MRSLLLCATLLVSAGLSAAEPGLIQSGFIFETNPVPSCHATTIVETRDGALLAAWFAGVAEGRPDVSIWTARRVGGKWTPPVKVAEGTQPDGSRFPCWNPVLFQPKDGPLQLYYKVGPNPVGWWGMLRLSDDNGKTWGAARRLPEGILGPIKNKPVQLKDGTILSGASAEGLKVGPSSGRSISSAATIMGRAGSGSPSRRGRTHRLPSSPASCSCRMGNCSRSAAPGTARSSAPSRPTKDRAGRRSNSPTCLIPMPAPTPSPSRTGVT
jgi:hypothetical protein